MACSTFPNIPGFPSILVYPEDVLVSAGSSGSLSCAADAVPSPTISWFRNGVEIQNESFASVTIIERDLGGQLLSILEVCLFESSLSGNFSCQALNIYGNQTVEFQLQVASGIYFCQLINWL